MADHHEPVQIGTIIKNLDTGEYFVKILDNFWQSIQESCVITWEAVSRGQSLAIADWTNYYHYQREDDKIDRSETIMIEG